MANVSRKHILNLYKALLRESLKFDSYNYRCYAIRRVRDGFRENKTLTDKEAIGKCVSKAQQSLDVIRRQVIIGKMYSTEKLVIENYLESGKQVSLESLQ